MRNLLIKDNHKIRDGLCIISAFDKNNIYIANINFCDETCTIKEYKNWERKNVKTAIPISKNEQSPQTFSNQSIKEVISLYYIMDLTFDKKEFDSLEKEDIIIPLIGGIIGDNFSELLKKLWDGDCNNIWEYEKIIQSHYKNIFRDILDNKEE